MTGKKHGTIRKGVFVMVVAILVASLAELLFNIPLFRAQGKRDITTNITWNALFGSQHQIIEVEYDTPHYIEYVHLKGFVMQDSVLEIRGKSINGFGKEESLYSEGCFLNLEEDAYIPVRKKMISYTVSMKTNTNAFYVAQVSEETEPRFNGYRFSLVCLTGVLVMALLVSKDIKKHLVLYFVIASLGYGSVMIFSTGTHLSTWDEETHFHSVYQMAGVHDDSWSEAAWRHHRKDIYQHNSLLAKEQVERALDEMDETSWYNIERNYTAVPYTKLAYVPMAAAMRIGHDLNLSFTRTYILVKLTNLIMYTALIAVAIYISKTRKLFIALLSLLPTMLFQGSMLTYDGFVFSMITLGIVLIANEVEDPLKPLNRANIMWAIVLIVVGSASKAIYIPLILFLFLLPKNKFANKTERLLFYGGLILVFLMVMSTFVSPTLSNALAQNTDFGGDSRGGDTGSVKQIISMVKHPLATVQLYLENIFGFDNLRNMGSEAYDHYVFPNLFFLNLGDYGVAKDKWVMLLIPLLLLMFFYNDEEEPFVYSKGQRWFFGTVVFVVVGLIWTAMYLSFTTIGNTTIGGVQARYYLPVLLPVSYALYGNRIKFTVKPETIRKLALGTVIFFETHLIYQLIILGTVS